MALQGKKSSPPHNPGVCQVFDFEELYGQGHEEVVFFSEPSCGLKAIVAIHDTTLGPALGGSRMWPYANIHEAITDVLRLSKGMTYKAAVAGLNLGGGKAVLICDPGHKSEVMLRTYGRFIESLNGRYITAEDVNMAVEDIECIAAETEHITGRKVSHGGSGDPSPHTARGVFYGMEACCSKIYGERSLAGKVVALQGCGAVGHHLGQLLHRAGCKIFFTDIDHQRAKAFQQQCPTAEWVDHEEIYGVQCDIYAPCALGATLNDDTIERLKCPIVAGAANNQLEEPRHGELLRQKGILYAPDYLVNAGGLMSVSLERDARGHSLERLEQMVSSIYDKALEIFEISERQNIPTNRASDLLAEQRLNATRKTQGKFIGKHCSHLPPL